MVICDSHHAVLRHWLHAADEEGRVPGEGLTVVHFDAHPDLAVPGRLLGRELRQSPDALLRALDIASFQLGAAWIGLVDRVVWLRPEWATQLPDGSHRFRLGATARGELRVDDPNDYWVLDDAWAPRAKLTDVVELRVDVMTLADAAQRPGALPDDAWILDIDLDGFATRNPSADRLRHAGLGDAELDRLRGSFARERLALAEEPEARIRDLEALLEAAENVSGGSLGEQLGGAWRLWRFGVSARDLLYFRNVFLRDDVSVGPRLMAEAGRDLVGLPEHRADARAIEATAAHIAALIGEDGIQPRLVTVARSANDGFTPREAWPHIEWTLLRALLGALGEAEVQLDAGLRPAPRASAER